MAILQLGAHTRAEVGRDYPFTPVPFTQVRLSDAYFAPRIEVNRQVTIPFAFGKCEETGRVALFERAGAALRGEIVDKTPPGFPFDDTDVYKVLEGASYCLAVAPDPKLDAYLDSLIVKIAAAQEPDGYLYCTRTISPEHPHAWSGTQRWQRETEASHELYNLGHLFEAAAAHYQATGKRSLLDVALKAADLLERTFGPGKRSIWPGHQIVEMGLVKLYRATGDEKYLKLAKFVLDARGPIGPDGAKVRGAGPYNQSQAPILEQTDPVGHAVRATYMYAGIADVAALTGDAAYDAALTRIWNAAISQHVYLTGGIGSLHGSEAFGAGYSLPNRSAYCETCASVANVYWNQRMFLLHGEGKYIDVLERTLYNAVLAGVSLDGKAFFYPNPLESAGGDERSPWFGCACCPGNITRFLASISGYVYARKGDDLFVNLYATSSARLPLAGGNQIEVTQQSGYPWEGNVKLTLAPKAPATFSLNLRIPGWAQNKPVPSDLYTFTDSDVTQPVLKINGMVTKLETVNGYGTVRREWKSGDTVELSLPMPVRRVVASDHVKADAGRMALQRGPIVYCAEWPDVKSGPAAGHVLNLAIDDNATVTASAEPQMLNGIELLHSDATFAEQQADGTVKQGNVPVSFIPYAAWANRGPGEMAVWIPRTTDAAPVLPPPTLASGSSIETSTGGHPLPGRRFDFFPSKNKTEFATITLPHEATVSQLSVTWFDDGARSSCRFPAGWRLFYLDGDTWKPVPSEQPLTVVPKSARGPSKAMFTPVATKKLRIEVDLPRDFSSGISAFIVQ